MASRRTSLLSATMTKLLLLLQEQQLQRGGSRSFATMMIKPQTAWLPPSSSSSSSSSFLGGRCPSLLQQQQPNRQHRIREDTPLLFRHHYPITTTTFRGLSTHAGGTGSGGEEATKEPEAPKEEENASTAEGGEAKEETEGASTSSSSLSREEQLEAEVKDLRDQSLRSLAEQDNTRRIARRDVDAAKQFAIKSVAVEMMTGDDLWEQFNPPVDEDVKSKCVHVLRAAYEETMKQKLAALRTKAMLTSIYDQMRDGDNLPELEEWLISMAFDILTKENEKETPKTLKEVLGEIYKDNGQQHATLNRLNCPVRHPCPMINTHITSRHTQPSDLASHLSL